MNRRDTVIALLAIGATAGPFAAFAQQQPGKTRRILLYTTSAQARDWFVAGMRDLGWIEGRNITVKVNAAQEVDEAALRSALLDRNQPVDVVVMAAALRIRAAMNVTETVPIVGIDLESDPVAGGFSMSRNCISAGTCSCPTWRAGGERACPGWGMRHTARSRQTGCARYSRRPRRRSTG
jgi:hypothetical protein